MNLSDSTRSSRQEIRSTSSQRLGTPLSMTLLFNIQDLMERSIFCQQKIDEKTAGGIVDVFLIKVFSNGIALQR